MKTLDEFRTFLDSNEEIDHVLEEVGERRKSFAVVFILMSVVSLLFVVSIVYFSMKETSNQPVYIIIGICFTLIALISLFAMRKNKGKDTSGRLYNDFSYAFKDKVIRKVIFFIDPSFRYKIDDSVFLDDLLTSGMLVNKNYNFEGNDLVWGIHEGVSFRFSDVTIRSNMYTDSFHLFRSSDPFVFKGSIMVAAFNKQFKSPVFIYPWDSKVQNLQCEGDEVRLESPEFMKIFRIYSPDQLEARYILSTSMMARIENLYRIMGEQLHIIFANNHVYIANNNYANRFEMVWTQSLRRKELLIQYYEELAEQLSIIEELKLNIKIWN